MGEQEAILAYMTIVQRMPSYGVHYSDVKVCMCVYARNFTNQHVILHAVQDKRGVPWKLGISPDGIAQYDYNDLSRPRSVCLYG